MLAADHRMRDGAAFRRTVGSGRRAGGTALVVHLLTDPIDAIDPVADAPLQVGFVVGKAVGNAVTRNRVRRRLRHLVRDRLSSLSPGTALVVRALPPAAGLGSAELAAELDRCLGRVRPAPATRTGAAS